MKDGFAFGALVAFFVAFCVAVNGCALAVSSDTRARHAVENFGATHVRVVSKTLAFGNLGGCSEDDTVKFKIVGTINGVQRTYKVCAVPPFHYTVRS